jgi:hypothetical protein
VLLTWPYWLLFSRQKAGVKRRICSLEQLPLEINMNKFCSVALLTAALSATPLAFAQGTGMTSGGGQGLKSGMGSTVTSGTGQDVSRAGQSGPTESGTSGSNFGGPGRGAAGATGNTPGTATHMKKTSKKRSTMMSRTAAHNPKSASLDGAPNEDSQRGGTKGVHGSGGE